MVRGTVRIGRDPSDICTRSAWRDVPHGLSKVGAFVHAIKTRDQALRLRTELIHGSVFLVEPRSLIPLIQTSQLIDCPSGFRQFD